MFSSTHYLGIIIQATYKILSYSSFLFLVLSIITVAAVNSLLYNAVQQIEGAQQLLLIGWSISLGLLFLSRFIKKLSEEMREST